MAARLTVTLCVLAVLVFTVVAVLLQRALEAEFMRAREQELAGKVDVVRHFLEELETPEDLPHLSHRLDDVLIGDGLMRLWLVTDAGEVLYGGKRRPAVTPDAFGRVEVRREDGLALEGLRIKLPAHDVLPNAELIVAIDVRGQQALLQRYRTTIGILCGIGVALTVLLTAWITRRSLQPVRRLSREAAALSPSALSARLSPVETSELQELVESFNRALARVEAAYSQLEAFSADVAHELRTPLATMINATEVALQRPRAVAELRETLELNLEVLREQAGLVNDMLFLARADQGQLADSLKPTDLRLEAQRVNEYLEPLLEDRQQRVQVEGDATAVCNPTLVRRATLNLVANATRYTPRGGVITIRLSRGPKHVNVTVRNPGAPIDPAVLPRLFDRFFRADAARERSSGHHGLGLAIVRAIALMHGGSTHAQSSDGWTEIGFSLAALPSLPQPSPT
ncbi:heavy metal sensor histidine kinase [Piscinibacter gummiphilus]|jgi:two-component system heavy metal sensor histidine kinase CusS|uniref:Sensor protein n=1 Tax=Piscinibacter gummiphilus TaxID=946333 RepID=A0ABZ0D0T4_9BURK|nr:heavy metal sensor histidine kinase [Piscinibacter gummiphilus]WOB10854.1 heavy metal sensor histidine kinase [Piscinibacter gummiphilus]